MERTERTVTVTLTMSDVGAIREAIDAAGRPKDANNTLNKIEEQILLDVFGEQYRRTSHD